MDSKQAKRFGNVLRQNRERLGLSTRQLAARTGIEFSLIARMERGELMSPAPEKLARIAEALRMPLADLYLLADYAVPRDLPTPSVYLRAKFRDLPAKELAAVTRDVERAFKAHGIDPSAAPAPGEDEQPEAPRSRSRTTSKKPKKGGKK